MYKKQTNPPTREQVREAWANTPKPNCRNVAQRMQEQGFTVGYKTVANYKKQGWCTAPVIQIAGAAPSDLVERVTAEMNDLIGKSGGMSLQELQERTRMALNVILMRRCAERADTLALMPKDVAPLIVALTDAGHGAPLIPNEQQPGTMIDVTPDKSTHPLTAAIHEFKRRTGAA